MNQCCNSSDNWDRLLGLILILAVLGEGGWGGCDNGCGCDNNCGCGNSGNSLILVLLVLLLLGGND